jgi:hypothetical protein
MGRLGVNGGKHQGREKLVRYTSVMDAVLETARDLHEVGQIPDQRISEYAALQHADVIKKIWRSKPERGFLDCTLTDLIEEGRD